MIESLNALTSVPSYKKISGIKSGITHTKEILNKYPKILLISGIALTALGSFAIAIGTASLFLPAISVALMGTGIAITAIGASILLATNIKWKHVSAYMIAVPLLATFGIQWTSTISLNRFEDRSCSLDNKLLGNVHHEQNAPILQLFTEDPYEMGLAQGYLLGEQVQEAFEQVLTPMMSLCSILTGDFSGNFYSQQVNQITIPEAYRREIQGLVAGVNQWAKQRGISSNLTEEQALKAHKLTDIYKAIGCQRLFGISGFNTFGCSTMVVKKGSEVAVGRTLDWPSLGKMGELAYIRRHNVNGKHIEMHTFAGMVGALTAYNQEGLVAIINENGIISRAGTPYTILARQIIEQNANVEQAETMINREDYQPASSHHLILADRNRAAVYQMVLENERKFIKRELDFTQENAFVAVTNHTVTEQNEILENTICDPTSKARFKAMTETLTRELQTNHTLDEVVKKSLQVVNVMDTIATAHFRLTSQNQQKVQVVKYTNNNYWAAKELGKNYYSPAPKH